MGKKIISMDIDGTLSDICLGVVEYMNKHFGQKIDYNSLTEYNIASLGFDQGKLHKMFNDPEFYIALPAFSGVSNLTKILGQEFDIIIQTVRPSHVRSETFFWLYKNKIYCDDIIFLQPNQGKTAIKPVFFFEDNPQFINEFILSEIPGLVVLAPYTKNLYKENLFLSYIDPNLFDLYINNDLIFDINLRLQLVKIWKGNYAE